MFFLFFLLFFVVFFFVILFESLVQLFVYIPLFLPKKKSSFLFLPFQKTKNKMSDFTWSWGTLFSLPSIKIAVCYALLVNIGAVVWKKSGFDLSQVFFFIFLYFFCIFLHFCIVIFVFIFS